MASTRQKPKKVPIQFEMSWSGFFFFFLFSLCLFVWMFLLGVWVGQTVLMPSVGASTSASIARLATRLWQSKNDFGTSPAPEVQPGKEAAPAGGGAARAKGGEAAEDPSFFAVQVAAYQDEKGAVKAVLQWRARGLHSFYLQPEGPDGTFFRVFVGQHDELVDANVAAAELEKQAGEKVFITLVSTKEKQYP